MTKNVMLYRHRFNYTEYYTFIFFNSNATIFVIQRLHWNTF